MIIDDGSSDNTKELVQSWIDERAMSIKYIYQENQGMHSAHNTAYKHIETELNVCIDSDDYLSDNAVEKIIHKWQTEAHAGVAGIVGLDAFKDGSIVGTKFPENLKESTLTEIYSKHHVKGDKKVVLSTEIVQKFPHYPVFKNERLVPLGTLYLLIDQQYKLLCSNDVYCIVEYLADGSSNNILQQYRKSPRGFAYNRNVKIRYQSGIKEKLKNAAHLVSSAIFTSDLKMLAKSANLPLTILAIPAGIMLNMYIRSKTKKV